MKNIDYTIKEGQDFISITYRKLDRSKQYAPATYTGNIHNLKNEFIKNYLLVNSEIYGSIAVYQDGKVEYRKGESTIKFLESFFK